MTSVAQARIRRLVSLGLVDTSCTPSERVAQLRSRTEKTAESAYERLETMFSALGDTTRLRMLALIADEELCSCEVMAALELTQPTTSHHLGILERAGLLKSRRNGKWVFYRKSDPKVDSLIAKGFSLAQSPD